MTTTDNRAEVLAGAAAHQLAVAARAGDYPVLTPDELDRQLVRELGCPGATVADAVMATTSFVVVAIDPNTLIASSAPLTSAADVLDHFRPRYADGVGLVVGEQRDGSSLVAVAGTQASWDAWIAQHGTVTTPTYDPDGRPFGTETGYLPMPPFSRHRWGAPSLAVRASVARIGQTAMTELGEPLRTDRGGSAEICWTAWAAQDAPGRRLTFPARELGHGLSVLGEGAAIPVYAVRRDGWTVSATRTPTVEPMPSWLIEALGGKWVKA